MSKLWLLLAISLVFFPSALFAQDMGGMGMMGMIVEKVPIQTKNVGEVIFDHTKHDTDCQQCHPKIFHKKRNSDHVNMKAMEKGKSCGACHNGKRAFSVKANCVICHAGDVVFKNADAGDVTFPHSTHIKMFSCDECHPDLFKAKKGADKMTMEAMENGQFCGACHDGSGAFGVKDDCENCHKM